MRRFFRFSIRDLLWLTLVVAVGLGWFVHQRQLRADGRRVQAEADEVSERATKLREAAGVLEHFLSQQGFRVEWGDSKAWLFRPDSPDVEYRPVDISCYDPKKND